MSEPTELPPRPDPPRRVRDVLAAWIDWLGPARLIAGALSVAAVAAGGYWLVRPPAPAPEAGLPVAVADAPPLSTLPTPVPSSPPAAAPASVVVHVAGAVRRPGVHELDGRARVHAAIDAAGGANPDADLDGLNLAATVVDGQRIYVPRAGEVDPAAVPSGGGSADSPRADPPAGPIDLNRATASELDALPGVGPATAAAIVDDRLRNGPFASVDDLDRVPGIGAAKLDALRDLVTV
jgi:competence protein ComEA